MTFHNLVKTITLTGSDKKRSRDVQDDDIRMCPLCPDVIFHIKSPESCKDSGLEQYGGLRSLNISSSANSGAGAIPDFNHQGLGDPAWTGGSASPNFRPARHPAEGSPCDQCSGDAVSQLISEDPL